MFLFLYSWLSIQTEEFEIYKTISDICHPRLEDLWNIQRAISQSPRPQLDLLADKAGFVKEFRLIGTLPNELPQYFYKAVNTKESDRENCIVIYASFNERFSNGAKRLFSTIASSDFIGHVHCRIGGWPNIENGSLALAHVPYAFKVCFFKEMWKKGYKRVLYLDASIIPKVSLNAFFDVIRQRGYFITQNFHTLGEFHFLREEVARYFGLGFEEAGNLLSCQAGIFGIDFMRKKGIQLIDALYEAAKDSQAFYSPRSDQTALSILLHKFGMVDWLPGPNSSYFDVDRHYVKNIQ